MQQSSNINILIVKIFFFYIHVSLTDMDMKFTTQPARPKPYAHNDVHFVCIVADDQMEII